MSSGSIEGLRWSVSGLQRSRPLSWTALPVVQDADRFTLNIIHRINIILDIIIINRINIIKVNIIELKERGYGGHKDNHSNKPERGVWQKHNYHAISRRPGT